jgi:UDP-N-acetylmuramate: L-alanyl-gamma-D-glutamyl-meso-diaminopimelate ligase
MAQRKNIKKWVHLIGICGVTMAPVAYMFKKLGWFVSGSDQGIFPPMSDYLKKRQIPIELGFKAEHLESSYYRKKYPHTSRGKTHPDLVVVGNFSGLSNPEYKYAQKLNLVRVSYPEVLKKYCIRDNSIVVAGTSGKTTCAGLLSLIFKNARKNPSYMIGGIPNNFPNGIHVGRGKWSIVEGDEYISSRFDPVSKFFHYKTEFLLLTGCSWEHTDFFKTEEDYINNFKKYIQSIPRHGIIVANKNGVNVPEVIQEARCKVITYEHNKLDNVLVQADWFNLPHKENKKIHKIVIFNKHTQEEFTLKTRLIGAHNIENIIGCCAFARELSIDIDPIQKSVEMYSGIKRRLEIRYKEENIKIIDDLACSPPKILGSLSALKESYSDWFITLIFEPNVGNRTKESLPLYKDVFNKANEVIIPHLKPVKTSKGEHRISGKELANFLQNEKTKVLYIGEDTRLIDYVTNEQKGKHIICFMGAYSFRGMIPRVIKIFKER